MTPKARSTLKALLPSILIGTLLGTFLGIYIGTQMVKRTVGRTVETVETEVNNAIEATKKTASKTKDTVSGALDEIVRKSPGVGPLVWGSKDEEPESPITVLLPGDGSTAYRYCYPKLGIACDHKPQMLPACYRWTEPCEENP